MSLWQCAYHLLTAAAYPLVHILLGWREDQGKEDPDRLHERFGYASVERPKGKLIWVHAASVGEAMSTLLLLEKLAALHPETHFLITTGTVTSARILATRLPPRTVHQYIPVDVPVCVARFMAHWQPDAALWLESELWPNLLAALRQRKIPAALLNARLSEKTQRNWRCAGGWIREMLGTFALVLTQTDGGQDGLRRLGAQHVAYAGNLKFAALPLPDDSFGRAKLGKSLGTRATWLFSSSHPGEEELAAQAHRILLETFPELLLVLVPRHPSRAPEILALLAKHGLTVRQRSHSEQPVGETQVYLADTLGELGLFYRQCPITVVGGSFGTLGGHNPIEPALLSAAVAFGPDMANFSEVAAAMLAQGAAQRVTDAASIATFVTSMMQDAHLRQKQIDAAQNYAKAQGSVHDGVITALAPVLKQAGCA